MADGVDVKIPTPIAANDLYFLGGGSSNARHAFYAVRAGVKGEIAINTLLRRMQDLRLSGATESLRWRPSMLLRGLESLPLSFDVTVR